MNILIQWKQPTVLARVVAAFECAVGTVNAIEEVVERAALDIVAGLVQEYFLLLADETEDVLQVKARLARVTLRIEETAVDADQSGAFANLVFGVVAEEDVEIVRVV